MRERALYRYLKALDEGDIDSITAVLQQSIYDASLEQMVLDSHRAYFQEEQAMPQIELQTEMPAAEHNTLRSGQLPAREGKRRVLLWMQIAAALLIVGTLTGGLVRFIMQAHPGNLGVSPTPTAAVCKPYSWQVTGAKTNGRLVAIAALSPNNAWAVGSRQISADSDMPLIEHWDGQRWSIVAGPALSDSFGTLEAIAAVSANDIWAVGQQYKLTGTGVTLPTRGHVLIEHWDGRSWNLVDAPSAMEGEDVINVLQSMAVLSPDDIWAVGETANIALHSQWSLLEHWDGKSWRTVSDASIKGGVSFSSLLTVKVIGNGQVLAGGAKEGSDGLFHAWLERWDGHEWKEVAFDQFGQNNVAVWSLGVLAENDIWAIVQYAAPNGGPANEKLLHWDGKNWNAVQMPDWMDNPSVFVLPEVITLATNDVWVIGGATPSKNVELIVGHWNGKSWQQEHVVNVLTGANAASYFAISDLAVSGGVVWIVGSMRPTHARGNDTNALIEQKQICP